MRCWRCGQEVLDGASFCIACGASLARTVPTSDAGRAMRVLFDRYGTDAVLCDPAYLGNGLGDLLQDSSALRSRLRSAIDVGVGRLYLGQIRGAGAPDAAFAQRVHTLLVGEAGLSDAAASEVAALFDEMVGWRAVPAVAPLPPEPPACGQSDGARPREAARVVEPAGTRMPPTGAPSDFLFSIAPKLRGMSGLERGLRLFAATIMSLISIYFLLTTASLLWFAMTYDSSLYSFTEVFIDTRVDSVFDALVCAVWTFIVGIAFTQIGKSLLKRM